MSRGVAIPRRPTAVPESLSRIGHFKKYPVLADQLVAIDSRDMRGLRAGFAAVARRYRLRADSRVLEENPASAGLSLEGAPVKGLAACASRERRLGSKKKPR
jgi:hypothetical protein